MKRVYYTIEKSTIENTWILWRMTKVKNSCGCYRVYSGTKKEVQEKLKELKGSDK